MLKINKSEDSFANLLLVEIMCLFVIHFVSLSFKHDLHFMLIRFLNNSVERDSMKAFPGSKHKTNVPVPLNV